MKLINKDVEKRVIIKLDKSITNDSVSGIMKFGINNDYPQIIEKLILGSQTAKSASNIFASFLSGSGFTNTEIGKVIVGIDYKGKKVTLDKMLRETAKSCSKFNGTYIHCNMNIEGTINKTKVVPFKNCRLSRQDDNGYCGKIAVHQNWERDPDKKTFNQSEISWYYNFNKNSVVQNIEDAGGFDKFKGQIFFLSLDDSYLYPLSQFDSVYLDMDTEYQIQLFRNREIRNGFSDKIVMHINLPDDELERRQTIEKCRNWMGSDGDKLLLFESEFDENGELAAGSNFKVDKIPTNINDKLFADWEKGLANNIRKAPYSIPAVLIDYEQGQLSQASGEMLTQATNYYNALTQPLRDEISEAIKEIYQNFDSDILKNNQDWSIKPVELLMNQVVEQDSPDVIKQKSQAELRGSVGGITALIQLQQSVSQQLTDIESAIATIVEIYGISDDIARKMIGTPKIQTDNNLT